MPTSYMEFTELYATAKLLGFIIFFKGKKVQGESKSVRSVRKWQSDEGDFYWAFKYPMCA